VPTSDDQHKRAIPVSDNRRGQIVTVRFAERDTVNEQVSALGGNSLA